MEYIKKTAQKEDSFYFRSLVPLLDALGWRGSKNTLYEAIPRDTESCYDLESLVSTLANLQFTSRLVPDIALEAIDTKNAPCLFITDQGGVFVILKVLPEGFLAYEAATGEYKKLQSGTLKGSCLIVSRDIISENTVNDKQDKWFKNLSAKFQGLIGIVLVITLVTTSLTLLQPTFVTALFSQISEGNSYKPLLWLGVGVLIYLVSQEVLNGIRFNILNHISTRIGYIIDNQIIRRILYLPLAFTEKASLSSQLARIKDFQSIQKFISGKAAISIFELPFTVILIAALFVIGGSLGFVPIAGMVVFAIFGLIMNNFATMINNATAQVSSKKQELTLEVLNNMEAIKDSNSEEIWLNRYVEFSSETVKTSLSSERINTFISNFSALVVSLSGMATIIAGTVKVINGTMTSGALIAAMLLTWRILNPIKTSFTTITQLNKLKKSIAQVDKLMGISYETNPVSSITIEKPFIGKIKFNQVSIRYQPDREPALVGANFSINENELILIRGHEGAGKSTILKLIDGLYAPQAGTVLIDDFNIKQINSILLRKSLSFMPQNADIFNGTIAYNLRLSAMNAKDEELIEAAKLANVYDDIKALEKGFDTILDRRNLRQYKESFLKKLCFARSILKKSNILLLDEPDSFFDEDECSKFIQTLKTLRKSKTILMVSNNRSFVKSVDKVMELSGGKISFFDNSSKFK